MIENPKLSRALYGFRGKFPRASGWSPRTSRLPALFDGCHGRAGSLADKLALELSDTGQYGSGEPTCRSACVNLLSSGYYPDIVSFRELEERECVRNGASNPVELGNEYEVYRPGHHGRSEPVELRSRLGAGPGDLLPERFARVPRLRLSVPSEIGLLCVQVLSGTAYANVERDPRQQRPPRWIPQRQRSKERKGPRVPPGAERVSSGSVEDRAKPRRSAAKFASSWASSERVGARKGSLSGHFPEVSGAEVA